MFGLSQVQYHHCYLKPVSVLVPAGHLIQSHVLETARETTAAVLPAPKHDVQRLIVLSLQVLCVRFVWLVPLEVALEPMLPTLSAYPECAPLRAIIPARLAAALLK